MSAQAAIETKPITAPSLTPVRSLRLQKATCGCGKPIVDGGECAECASKKRLQRSSAGHAPSALPGSVQNVLSSPGQPLDATTRAEFEPRFGHDFSQVRVHADSAAAASANDVNAHAYTVGQDIAFAEGRYDPHSSSGRELLAHELAHTVQQSGLQRSAKVSMDEGPEYHRLEREAESAAKAVTQGGSVRVGSASEPRLSRAAAKKPKLASAIPASANFVESEPGKVQGLRRFDIKDPFPVPPEKGPVLENWRKLASSGGLEAVVEFKEGEPKIALKQSRYDLRLKWLEKVGWAEADAPSKWKLAGGSSASYTPPKAGKGGGKTCNMDHIVELQVGGSDIASNMQVLDESPNKSSGGQVRGTIERQARLIRDADPQVNDETIILRYKTADQNPPVSITDTTPCLQVEQAALKGIKAVSAVGGGSNRVPMEHRGATAEVEIAPTEVTIIADSEQKMNQNAAKLVPGLRLTKLTQTTAKGAVDTVDAEVDTKATKLPMDLKAPSNKQIHFKRAHDAVGTMTLGAASPNIEFLYKYLSPGFITSVTAAESGGINWSGHIKPTVPFLGRLDVNFNQGVLSVVKGLEKDKVKKLFPGVTVVEANVAMQLGPEFKPSGVIKIELAAGKTKIGAGQIDVSATPEQGLVLNGTLDLLIPGVDAAQLTVKYSGGLWSGEAAISTAQIKMPYVKSANLTACINGATGVSVDGNVLAELPGGRQITLNATKPEAGGKWGFTGTGVILKGDRFDEVNVVVSYDGETLTATGKTGFTFFNQKGKMNRLTYKAKKGEAGKFSGEGTITVTTSKANGLVTVELLDSGKLKGTGSLSYQLTKTLTAKVGVKIDDDEKLTLNGALTIAEIRLFEESAGTKNLFRIEKNIPIPGASIGPIGLQAKIGGAVDISYGVGPGTLKNVTLAATFNPLENNPDIAAAMTARLDIPAYAKLSGSVTGGIALDAGIAEVAGGITLLAYLMLKGGLAADFKGNYAKHRFTVDAFAEISAVLNLGLGLSAWVTAKAGIGALSVNTRKDWLLKKLEVPTGLNFKLKAPVKYASDQPFTPPTLNSIEWSPPPKIDPGDLLKRVFAAATARETKS